ncbi:MAG: (d)CMP kinase [Firmicutes bacterium]|nr:(d)CMP kinase [Bacillota bacterium]
MRIAIDGPAGAGKSTIARMIAERLGLLYIDTGAMYRALTYMVLANNVDPNNEKQIAELIKKFDFEIRSDEIFLAGQNITRKIREPEVTANVSLVASHFAVRQALVDLQKQIAQQDNVVMDGRDIGTCVMPDADLKIFLKASVKERARRRALELARRGFSFKLEEIEEQIRERDTKDSNREISPLRKAEDAFEIDTTDLTIEEVVEQVLLLCARGKTNV